MIAYIDDIVQSARLKSSDFERKLQPITLVEVREKQIPRNFGWKVPWGAVNAFRQKSLGGPPFGALRAVFDGRLFFSYFQYYTTAQYGLGWIWRRKYQPRASYNPHHGSEPQPVVRENPLKPGRRGTRKEDKASGGGRERPNLVQAIERAGQGQAASSAGCSLPQACAGAGHRKPPGRHISFP